MNRQEAGRIVAVIVASCPAQASRLDAPRTASMIDTYATLLEDLSYEQCNAAVRVLLQTSNWMPSVAEIRSAALELNRGPVRAGGEAWGDVLRLISRYGARRYDVGWKAPIEDPIAAHCVESLGWVNLCDSENPTADRARFIELYDQLAARKHRESLSPLLGAANEKRQLEAAQRKRIERTGTASVGNAMATVLALVPQTGDDQ